MIQIGEINSFIVLRKSDLGYMLSNKDDQLLLHFNQTNGEELEEGEMVECFVQYDSKGRLSATLETPSVTMSKPGWATVVEANARLGVFVRIDGGTACDDGAELTAERGADGGKELFA